MSCEILFSDSASAVEMTIGSSTPFGCQCYDKRIQVIFILSEIFHGSGYQLISYHC